VVLPKSVDEARNTVLDMMVNKSDTYLGGMLKEKEGRDLSALKITMPRVQL